MRSARATGLFAGLFLAALTCAVYLPVAGHPLLLFDDDQFVTDNPQVRVGLNPASVRWALTALHGANWHPVTWISHLSDVSLFGLSPGPHHLVNLLWHCCAALVVFPFLRRATGRLWPSFLVAALFALHPLHVESVAWVAERKDLLSTLLWFATIGAWLRYARAPGPGRYALVAATFGSCVTRIIVPALQRAGRAPSGPSGWR